MLTFAMRIRNGIVSHVRCAEKTVNAFLIRAVHSGSCEWRNPGVYNGGFNVPPTVGMVYAKILLVRSLFSTSVQTFVLEFEMKVLHDSIFPHLHLRNRTTLQSQRNMCFLPNTAATNVLSYHESL